MVCGFHAGKTNIEILKFNNIPHGTVRNFRMVWNKFLEDGGREEDYDVKRENVVVMRTALILSTTSRHSSTRILVAP